MENDNTTKLDQLSKDDPQLSEKTSNLIQKRQQEELRKAVLKEELKMAKAREEARAKKQSLNPPKTPIPESIPTSETQSTSPINLDTKASESISNIDSGEYVKKEKVTEIVAGINKSFAWLEQYVVQQNAQNAKVDKFILGLQNLINEYNKK
jgi:hypothetical protein